MYVCHTYVFIVRNSIEADSDWISYLRTDAFWTTLSLHVITVCTVIFNIRGDNIFGQSGAHLCLFFQVVRPSKVGVQSYCCNWLTFSMSTPQFIMFLSIWKQSRTTPGTYCRMSQLNFSAFASPVGAKFPSNVRCVCSFTLNRSF